MKIVNAKIPKSKAEIIRNICKEICDTNKAVFVELPTEYKYFLKVAKSAKYQAKSRCLQSGGYQIWISKEQF